MVEVIKKYVYIGAVFYALVCFLDALFIPLNYSLDFDNYLFPFGLIHLVFVIIKVKRVRMFLLFFILIFLWGIYVEYFYQNTVRVEYLYQLFYFIKWPVLMVVFLNPGIQLPQKESIHKIVDTIFLVSSLLSIVMIINPFNLGFELQNLYAPKEYINFIYYNKPGTYRLAGVFLNSNDNALFLGAFILYYVFHRTKKAWYFLTLAILLFFIAQSRTVLLGLLAIVLFYFIYKVIKNKIIISKTFKKSIMVFLLIGVFVMSISKNLQSLLTGKAFQSNSIMIRYNNLKHFISDSDANKLMGSGVINDPLKNIGVYIDSELVAILMQFGVVGLVLWSFLFFGAFRLSLFIKYNKFLFLYFLLIFIASLTNYTFLGGQSGVIISFFIALHFYLNRGKLESQ